MSSPVEGGRGVRVRLFGFPVHIDLSFVLIMGLIGWLSGARGATGLIVWLVVAALAVLVHELGHAVVARTTGARPAIALTGFGGLTTYSPPGPVSRARSLAISLAGPFTGLAVGGVLKLVDTSGPYLEYGSVPYYALHYGLFTTIAWSVLNLIPVVPLDGGQAMREVLPGPPEVRARRAAMVSLVVLVPLIGVAIWFNQPFIAVFMLAYGVANAQDLRSSRPAAGAVEGVAGPRVTPEQAVVGLLWQGAAAQARQVMESLPPGTPVDLAVHGAVLAVTGPREQGEALLAQELARRPGDENVAALLVLAHALRHDWPAIEADLAGPLGAIVPLTVVERVLQEAQSAGRGDVVSRLSALPLRRPRTAG